MFFDYCIYNLYMANLYIIIYIDNCNVVFMAQLVANMDFTTYYYGFYTLQYYYVFLSLHQKTIKTHTL